MAGAMDDPSIDDSCEFYRRIHPDHYTYDENLHRCRISSAAFKDYETSGDLQCTLDALGVDPVAHCLRSFPGHGLACMQSGKAREHNQAILRDPIKPDPDKGEKGNPAHGLMVGKKTGKISKRLAEAAMLMQVPRM